MKSDHPLGEGDVKIFVLLLFLALQIFDFDWHWKNGFTFKFNLMPSSAFLSVNACLSCSPPLLTLKLCVLLCTTTSLLNNVGQSMNRCSILKVVATTKKEEKAASISKAEKNALCALCSFQPPNVDRCPAFYSETCIFFFCVSQSVTAFVCFLSVPNFNGGIYCCGEPDYHSAASAIDAFEHHPHWMHWKATDFERQ